MKNGQIYDFNLDIETGKIGEQDLIELINRSKIAIGYRDVSNVKEYQDKEIDIIQINETNEITYEVKTDRQGLNTRNLAIELTSYNKIGAFPKCKAEYIYYVFVDPNDKITVKERYLIDTYKLKIYLGDICNEINTSHDFRLTYVNSKDTKGNKIGGINLLMNVDRMVKDSKNIAEDYHNFFKKV